MSPRGRRLTTAPSHGKSKKRTPLRERRASVSGEPERFWKTSQRTQRESNPHSLTLIPALSSQMPNGPMSLQDGQSTWITSLADSTQYSKTRNKSRKWETSRSQSGHLPQLDKSDPTETGPSLGTKPSGPSHMSSLTEKTSSETTGSISQNSSLLYRLGLTKELYSLTKPSELELGCDGMSTYLTEKVTTTLSPFGSKQVELTRDHRMAADQVTPNNDDEKAVDDGTKAVVPTHRPIATTPIPAVNAEVADTPPKTVLDHRKSNLFEKWTSRPRYARNLVWADSDRPRVLSVDATLTAEPFPDPPINSPHTQTARDTIAAYPELFKIVTPINVDLFEFYLEQHPNRAFVMSVCKGLREGFWPHADTSNPELPETWDNSNRYALEPRHIETVRRDIDAEISADRYSKPFGPDLLPGMDSMPYFVIPKPLSVKFRVVIDHSAEPHSLNSCIPRDKVSVVLDNMHDLGLALRHARLTHPDEPLVLIKSDVSQAYRRLPMHPLWQIRQVVSFGTERHVDRCNIWGDRGAGHIWCSFMGLVLWIAREIKKLEDMFAYVDDAFSWEIAGNLEMYEPYDALLPEKQVRLLELWDELGIPHEQEKQLFGSELRIIGFLVNSDTMTITMPRTSLLDLVDAIEKFAHSGVWKPLRDFQKLGGWINWALNVFPLLRPGLSVLYDKMSGKIHAEQLIWISVALCRELQWIANHMKWSSGVHILRSREWTAGETDYLIYADACPTGMGFWIPSHNLGYQCQTLQIDDIFWAESLTVVSALDWFTQVIRKNGKRLVIFTDNTNTVNMFNSLHAKPDMNPLLITAMDLVIGNEIDLRVFHVAGHDNSMADALSRFKNRRVLEIQRNTVILNFIPPQLTMGAYSS